MATMKKNSKGQVAAVAKQLIAGAEKHLTGVTQVPLAGGSYTLAQITSTLQSLVNLRADVDASKASTRAKIANEATQMPALRAFLSAIESFVKGAFGPSPDVLADFGIIPKARKTVGVASPPRMSAPQRATGRVDITDELRRFVLCVPFSGRQVDAAGCGCRCRPVRDRLPVGAFAAGHRDGSRKSIHQHVVPLVKDSHSPLSVRYSREGERAVGIALGEGEIFAVGIAKADVALGK